MVNSYLWTAEGGCCSTLVESGDYINRSLFPKTNSGKSQYSSTITPFTWVQIWDNILLNLHLLIFSYLQWINWLCNVTNHRNLSPTFRFPSTLQAVLASFRPLFWFCGPKLYCCGSLSLFLSTSFPAAAVLCESFDKPTVHYTCSAADRQCKGLAGELGGTFSS